jgi:hypothetical protein
VDADLPDLSSLPPDRAEAVKTWLTSTTSVCRICGEGVTPISSRIRDPDEPDDTKTATLHLKCYESLYGPDPRPK